MRSPNYIRPAHVYAIVVRELFSKKGLAVSEPSTKDKIRDAMYSLVAEKGYDKASVSQVCTLVGISKPALYYYFASKEELFLDMVKSLYPVLDPEDKGFVAIVDTSEYFSYLYKMGRSILANYHGDEERRRVLAEIDMQATRIPAVAQHQQRLTRSTIDAFAAVLRHGVDIGALPKDYDIESAAQYLFVITSGFSTLVAQNADVDTIAVWERTVDLLLLDAQKH